MYWTDTRLTWNPDKYGGTTCIAAPSSDVWKPRLVLSNTIDSLKPVGKESVIIQVCANGVVSWWPGEGLQIQCKADVTYYPFDVQTCSVIFVVKGHVAHEILLKSPSDTIMFYSGTGINSPNSEWDILSTSAYVAIDRQYVVSYANFTLQMSRRPKYVVVNVLIPIVFLNALNLLVFLIPAESGERLSYAITVLYCNCPKCHSQCPFSVTICYQT
jgi:hypothetical protein